MLLTERVSATKGTLVLHSMLLSVLNAVTLLHHRKAVSDIFISDGGLQLEEEEEELVTSFPATLASPLQSTPNLSLPVNLLYVPWLHFAPCVSLRTQSASRAHAFLQSQTHHWELVQRFQIVPLLG